MKPDQSEMLSVAICSYNRSDRLPALVRELRLQECRVPFEILVVDNNSADDTQAVLGRLAAEPGAPLRFVCETGQGIVPARNRAIEETLSSAYLVFIDDDELPLPGFLDAAAHALGTEGAQCVGGRIIVPFQPGTRPGWLGEELVCMLGKVDHGGEPFWIKDQSTPVWSGNVGYATAIFADGLRFDTRYNRVGKIGFGGSDAIMFQTLLARGTRMRYRPDMAIEHFVEYAKLTRAYFLNQHYGSGKRRGRWGSEQYGRAIAGVPPFMVAQALRQGARTLSMLVRRELGAIRQAMNLTYALGMIVGRYRKWREEG